jgi:hypothetical protein
VPSRRAYPADAVDLAATLQEHDMPRYIVERTFTGGLRIPMDKQGALACRHVVDNNAAKGVTWVHSYVSHDLGKTFCVYDGPSPESIREAAAANNQPVDRITAVSVLDPYFYQG